MQPFSLLARSVPASSNVWNHGITKILHSPSCCLKFNYQHSKILTGTHKILDAVKMSTVDLQLFGSGSTISQSTLMLNAVPRAGNAHMYCNTFWLRPAKHCKNLDKFRPNGLHKVYPGGGRLLSSGTRLPPLPPPPPCPPGPLSCQGSTAIGHTYGGAEGAQNFFFHWPCPFCPLCTPTLSLNPNLTLMPTPTLSLLLTLPSELPKRTPRPPYLGPLGCGKLQAQAQIGGCPNGSTGSSRGKKMTFLKNDPKPCATLKQVFLDRFELVVAHFGPPKIPKCLENGLFWDQKWVKNGSKTHFSKPHPRPFGVHKRVK